MEIRTTLPGYADFDLFEAVPHTIYPTDSLRLQQTDALNREFLQMCFVALEDGKPVGRAALYDNPNLTVDGKRAACLGNYECAERDEIASKLLEKVLFEAKNSGFAYILGPMNGSTWDNYRFSTHHDAPNFLLEPYHHLYYNDQFTAAGFAPVAEYTSGIDTEVHCNDPAVLQREAEFLEQGVLIRSIRLESFEEELQKLYPFVKRAFRTNALYTPIAWETFRDKYLQAKAIIDPEMVLVAEDRHGDTVGFIFCYRNLYNRDALEMVVKTIARHPDRQWSGLGHVLANRVVSYAKQSGYISVIHAFMIRMGTSTGISGNFLGTVYKNYSLYGRAL